MQEIAKIKIVKETKPLRAKYKLIILQPGDVLLTIDIIGVGAFIGCYSVLKIGPSLAAAQLIAGGFAEAYVDGST
jgi:hypothetical protein